MALSAEEAKKLLDSLFALPDKAEKKPKAKPAVKTAAPSVMLAPKGSNKQIGPRFSPALRITEVVTQECRTCGGRHEYVRPSVIRYEDKKDTLCAAREIPTAVLETLPHSIIDAWETVDQCPSCIKLGPLVDTALIANWRETPAGETQALMLTPFQVPLFQ